MCAGSWVIAWTFEPIVCSIAGVMWNDVNMWLVKMCVARSRSFAPIFLIRDLSTKSRACSISVMAAGGIAFGGIVPRDCLRISSTRLIAPTAASPTGSRLCLSEAMMPFGPSLSATLIPATTIFM